MYIVLFLPSKSYTTHFWKDGLNVLASMPLSWPFHLRWKLVLASTSVVQVTRALGVLAEAVPPHPTKAPIGKVSCIPWVMASTLYITVNQILGLISGTSDSAVALRMRSTARVRIIVPRALQRNDPSPYIIEHTLRLGKSRMAPSYSSSNIASFALPGWLLHLGTGKSLALTRIGSKSRM